MYYNSDIFLVHHGVSQPQSALIDFMSPETLGGGAVQMMFRQMDGCIKNLQFFSLL